MPDTRGNDQAEAVRIVAAVVEDHRLPLPSGDVEEIDPKAPDHGTHRLEFPHVPMIAGDRSGVHDVQIRDRDRSPKRPRDLAHVEHEEVPVGMLLVMLNGNELKIHEDHLSFPKVALKAGSESLP